MEDLLEENRSLREKNTELAQEVQFLKTTLSQKDKELIDQMKESNELRLKLSRLRSGAESLAMKLDASLQAASEEALAHLVQASGSIARTIEITKKYMMERQELDAASPRWSNLGGTPNSDRVHKVPPLLLGGQSIQPVVSLSRTMLSNRSANRSPNPEVTHRVVPVRLLQDAYIPLTRIDAGDLPGNLSNELRNNSTNDMDLDDTNGLAEESQHNTTEDFDDSQRLDAVMEDIEPEDEVQTPPRILPENPLEGPSWLLDASTERVQSRNGALLEADSTTPCDLGNSSTPNNEPAPAPVPEAFTPTVRRRKRPTASNSPSPRTKNSGRVLKVVVSKLQLPGRGADDGPSTRGATHSAVVVSLKRPAAELPMLNGHPSGADNINNTSAVNNSAVNNISSANNSTANNSTANNSAVNNSAANNSTVNNSTANNSAVNNTAANNSAVNNTAANNSAANNSAVNSTPNTNDTGVTMRRRRRCSSYKEPLNACSPDSVASEHDTEEAEVSKVLVSRRRKSVVSRPPSRHDSDSDTSEIETKSRRMRKPVSYKEKPLNSEHDTEEAEVSKVLVTRRRKSVVSRPPSRHDSDSDTSEIETKSRRMRKPVSYKEKPLNRKMRR